MKKNLTFSLSHWDKGKCKSFFMRLGLLKLMLIFGLLSTHAHVNSQTIISKLKLEEVELAEALERIEELSSYDFVFNYNDLKEYKVSVDFEEISLENCLNQVLKDVPFEYQIKGDVVVISYEKKITPKQKQKKKILKGTVRDTDGMTMPGVSIYINMTSIGTTTDIDGKYTLHSLKKGDVIVYSFIGMDTQEVIYEGQDVININLKYNQANIDEVVVTGFQTISKERATGSYVKLSSDNFEKVIAPSLVDHLEGNIVGLDVNKKGDIIIRGTSTFKQFSSPLVVVDGFPIEGGLESINSLNIESVTVLKDAVSASIYGVNSASGIIVVTTKKGEKGKLSVDFTYNLSVKNVQDLGDLERMGTSDAVDFQKEIIEKGYYDTFFSTVNKTYLNRLAEIEYRKQNEGLTDQQALALEDELRRIPDNAVEKQYEDYFLRRAVFQQANLSVRGANDKANYSLSVKADKNISGVKHNSGDKYFIDAKYAFDLSDKVKVSVGVNVNKSQNINNSPFSTGNYTTGSHPFELLKKDGRIQRVGGATYYDVSLIKDNPVMMQNHAFYNPITQVGTIDDESNNDLNRYQLKLDYKIAKELDLVLMYQNETNTSTSTRLLSPENYDQSRIINENTILNSDGSFNQVLKGLSQYDDSYAKTNYDLFRGVLNFKKLYKEDHYLTALGGFEYSVRKDNSKRVFDCFYDASNGNGGVVSDLYNTSWHSPLFPERTFHAPRIGARISNENYSKTRQFISLFSNFAYSYKSKYNLTASVRVDQGNIYNKDSENKYKPLWSLGGSWNLQEETFFKDLNIDAIDRLHIKASYGITGQINKGETALTIMAKSGIYNGIQDHNNLSSYGRLSYPNVNFKWEETNYTNIGIDYSLFKGVLVGSVEYFNKYTVDLANNVPIDPTNGASSMLNNNAELSNKGVDVQLTAKILDGKFKWTSSLNMSHLKSKILKYYSPVADSIVVLKNARREGYAMGSYFTYDFAGLDKNGYSTIRKKDGTIVSSDQVITSIDRVISSEDLVNTGSTVPKYTGGFNNTFTYKGLSLLVNISYKLGHVMQANSLGSIQKYTQRAYYADLLKDRWTPNNTQTNIPKINTFGDVTGGYSNRFYNDGDVNIVDASNIRLRRIALNYQLSNKIAEKLKIESATFNFQVANLGTLWVANDLGIDPRTNNNGERGLRTPIEYSLGVSVKF